MPKETEFWIDLTKEEQQEWIAYFKEKFKDRMDEKVNI